MPSQCIQCEQRPVWRPYSHYVCQECYDEIMDARAQCPCPCHQTNPTPAMCCTDRHLIVCPSLIPALNDGNIRTTAPSDAVCEKPHNDGDVATSSGSTSSKLVDGSGAPNDG